MLGINKRCYIIYYMLKSYNEKTELKNKKILD